MLSIKKQNVLNQDNEISSVIIDYKDFLYIEEILENHGLSQLIDEVKSEEHLELDEAFLYYKLVTQEGHLQSIPIDKV